MAVQPAPDQATKDAHDRLAIIESFMRALEQGDKSLIGNDGFRRFVTGSGGHWRIVYGLSLIEPRQRNEPQTLCSWRRSLDFLMIVCSLHCGRFGQHYVNAMDEIRATPGIECRAQRATPTTVGYDYSAFPRLAKV